MIQLTFVLLNRQKKKDRRQNYKNQKKMQNDNANDHNQSRVESSRVTHPKQKQNHFPSFGHHKADTNTKTQREEPHKNKTPPHFPPSHAFHSRHSHPNEKHFLNKMKTNRIMRISW